MMRQCGMLLPVSSLPSPYGIGAFSKEAYHLIDQLKQAGQQYWQILPLGPTGYGDSPYQSFSAFAGNPYFIDLVTLIEEGLLERTECEQCDFGNNNRDIDYEKLYNNRFPLLKKAYHRWVEAIGIDKAVKLTENELLAETREYCFYMAVKNFFGGTSWTLWDEEIRIRNEAAVRRYRQELSEEILFYEFQQLKFHEQWRALKSYANQMGIQIIGDIPIYVAFDSADSWSHPELFQFDRDNKPVAVAGCPPDGFSATGQLWGNPLYCWDYHRENGYEWWMQRMAYNFLQYDIVRVDHFRGFDEYYAIPYGNETAEIGQWMPGPGIEIFKRMYEWFETTRLPIIAEDLGFLTPSVLKLVKDTGFPGMKVLEFAFDSREESDYLPHNYEYNCVVYTGTHDNNTIRGWYQSMNQQDRTFAAEYIGNNDRAIEQVHWDFIRVALASVAKLAIIPVPDYLGADTEARMNEPSTLGKNWRWRMAVDDLTPEIITRCRRMAKIYGRFQEY